MHNLTILFFFGGGGGGWEDQKQVSMDPIHYRGSMFCPHLFFVTCVIIVLLGEEDSCQCSWLTICK